MSRFELNEDQRRAAEQLCGRVLIAAGAGSGKTRVLTERGANAVVGVPSRGWSGIGIDELLAITFTEKAAGELSERIRAALRAAGRVADARRVDAAWISTIHGMCSRILKAGALEAGIDPAFVVLDTVEGATLRQKAFEDVATRALAADPNAARLFTLYGYQPVAGSVVALGEALQTAQKAAIEISVAGQEGVAGLLDEAVAFFAEMSTALGSEEAAAAKLHCAHCNTTSARLEALVESGLDEEGRADELWRVLAEHDLPGVSKGVRDQVAGIRETRRTLAARTAAAATRGPAEAFLRLTDAYLNRFCELKRARSALDFDDLQIEALRYLEQDDAAEWADRFKLTMVDEFQDTDSLQLRLVERLAGDNLCTVGDERQSIYAFRGASIDVYRRHRRAMVAQGAEPIELKVNYRSHGQVLRFVNRVFDTPEMFGGELVLLQHGRLEPEPPRVDEDTPRVEVLIANKEEDARAQLAEAIARRFAVLTRQGVPARDMAVLVRSYKHADAYAQAFRRHGLDAIVVGGSRFFDRPEVAALRSFVRLLANGRDEAALGGVLCSDLCRLSDDGLLALRTAVDSREAQSLWDALAVANLGPADHIRADRLQSAVMRARDRMGRRPLAEVLLQAAEETGLDARLLAAGLDGGQAYANVLKFARLATAFENQLTAGASAFAAYLDAKEEFGDHEAPASLVRDGSDAVQIMSVHASKGLEFPVIAVPELDSRGGHDRLIGRWDLAQKVISLPLPASWDGRPEFRRPRAFCELKDAAAERQAEEDKRLLYVAFTRAEDVLILAGSASFKPTSAENTPLRLVMRTLGLSPAAGMDITVDDGEGPICRIVDVGCEQAEERAEPTDAEPPGEDLQIGWLQAIEASSADDVRRMVSAPNRLSYSGLKAFARCPRSYRFERQLGLGTDLPQTATPTDFGSAFHAVAELYGETACVDMAQVERIARSYGLPEGTPSRLRDALNAYRSSSVAVQVAHYPHVRREVAFAVEVGTENAGFLLDGSIDVYAVDGPRALIVDYKTGVSKQSEDEARQAYELQARCYALAALRDGREAVEVVFVRPECDAEPVSFDFGTADAADTERNLLALYGRIASGEAGPTHSEGSPGCSGCSVASSCVHTAGSI